MSSSSYHRQVVLFVAVAVVSAGAFVPATAVISGGGGRRGRFPWDGRGGGEQQQQLVRTSGIIRPRPRRADATAASEEVGQDTSSSQVADASTNSSSDSASSESVHLQLKSPAMMASMKEGDDNNDNGDGLKVKGEEGQSGEEPEDRPKLTKFRTYRSTAASPLDVDDAVIMYSLGLPLRKFKLFIHANTGTNVTDIDDKEIMTEDVDLRDSAVRKRMRILWQSGTNIITDRTEFLAVYESERKGGDDEDIDDSASKVSSAPSSLKRQRGDFADLLSMYADRLVGIIVDEQDEELAAAEKARQIQKIMQRNMTEAAEMEHNLKDGVSGGLVGYLQREYGEVETDALMAKNLLASGRTKEEQYATLQMFLDWFRQRFPYYYDRCGNCGASAKEDNYLDPSCRASPEGEGCGENEGSSEDDSNEASDCHKFQKDNADEKDDGTTFLGYVHPDEKERRGKAGRTEVYCCHKCGAISRFPRFNSASSVLRSRVGRCGEYSMLILRFFRALGFDARWVVDWSDHVWAEVRMSGDWIHVDPCEAAIDNPLLYESWGKKQTHIVAFHPSVDSSHADSCIEDVTTIYTSDNTTAIEERREDPAELIETSLVDTRKVLQTKLRDVLQSSSLDSVHAEST